MNELRDYFNAIFTPAKDLISHFSTVTYFPEEKNGLFAYQSEFRDTPIKWCHGAVLRAFIHLRT